MGSRTKLASIENNQRYAPSTTSESNQNPEEEIEVPEDFLEMTLQEHLEELRQRILYSVIAIFIALIAAYFLTDRLLQTIATQAKVPNEEILTITPTEGFVTWLKVLLYIAIAISMPMLVYQLVAFMSPGLTSQERRLVYISLPVVTLFFIAGVLFAFFLVIPRALDFLSNFRTNIFAWNPRASEIVSFYIRLMLGIGIAFQLPIVMFLLSKLHIVSAKRMASARKIAIILVMIAAAVITPTPDPINMMLVAIPIYMLYELGIIFARLAERTDRKNAAAG